MACPAPGMMPFFLQAVCDCISPTLFDVLTWLGYCNSTLNPIIYPLFMRDFKRALGRLLPCPHCPREPQASPVSPSMRTSHSGARPGLSLQHVLPLPRSDLDSDSCSGLSSGLQHARHLLLPGQAARDPPPPARAAASATTASFSSMDPAEPELLPLQPPGTPTN